MFVLATANRKSKEFIKFLEFCRYKLSVPELFVERERERERDLPLVLGRSVVQSWKAESWARSRGPTCFQPLAPPPSKPLKPPIKSF